MKKSNNFYIHIGIGIACFLVGASQIYRGLEPLDYLPIIVVGICCDRKWIQWRKEKRFKQVLNIFYPQFSPTTCFESS